MRNTLIFLLYFLVQVRSKCLDGFSVSNYSSTTVSLSWEYSCSADDIETYKVDYVHKNYKSCSDGRRDKSKPSGFGTVEVLEPRVVIQNLHPYSEYSFEVRVIIKGRNGRPESKTVLASTDYSIPKVKAQPSSLDYSYRNTDTKLVFNWSPPLQSTQCNLYYSELGSFLYQVQGTSEWNRRYFKEDSLEISETLVEIDGLEPYSDYLFLLFISNTENEYDEDVYLRLEGRTLSSEPDPPERLVAEPSDEGTIYFRWRPRNPKKGKVVKCVLKKVYLEQFSLIRLVTLDSLQCDVRYGFYLSLLERQCFLYIGAHPELPTLSKNLDVNRLFTYLKIHQILNLGALAYLFREL